MVQISQIRRGGCLCGAVCYSVKGEPFRYGLCHCADCRKESGGFFVAYAHWPAGAFEASGPVKTFKGRSFCPTCGSRLFNLHRKDVEVRLGSLDEPPTGLGPPKVEAWTKRREIWLAPIASAKQFSEDPFYGPSD